MYAENVDIESYDQKYVNEKFIVNPLQSYNCSLLGWET